MKKRAIYNVFGRVQGVFFRAYTKSKGEELGLSGIVENFQDGTVRVEAEGEEEKLFALKTALEKGSRLSKVDKVSVETSDELMGFDGFVIRYKNFIDRF